MRGGGKVGSSTSHHRVCVCGGGEECGRGESIVCVWGGRGRSAGEVGVCVGGVGVRVRGKHSGWVGG